MLSNISQIYIHVCARVHARICFGMTEIPYKKTMKVSLACSISTLVGHLMLKLFVGDDFIFLLVWNQWFREDMFKIVFFNGVIILSFSFSFYEICYIFLLILVNESF